MAGNESIYLTARSAGADGIISGVGAAFPELIVALDHAICNSDLHTAEFLNTRLLQFLEHVNRFPPTVCNPGKLPGRAAGSSTTPQSRSIPASRETHGSS